MTNVLKNKPIISVITITYNDLSGLKRTCDSIHNQTLQNFEHIIVDGASSDGSVEYVQQNVAINKNVAFTTELDKGIYDAMNKGIKQSCGEWLIFINSGDEFTSPDTLSSLVVNGALSDESSMIVYGHKLDKHNELIKSSPDVNVLEYGELFACHQSILFRDKSLYNDSYKIFGDFELLARLYKKYGPEAFIQLDNPIAIFEGGGISSKITKTKRIEKIRAIYEHFGIVGLTRNYFFNPSVWRKLFNWLFK